MSNLLSDIIEHAHRRGLSQKDLAMRAGIAEGSLSRAKRKGSLSSNTLEELAKEAGVRLMAISLDECPVEGDHNGTRNNSRSLSGKKSDQSSFQDKHRLLAWSNPSASVDVLLRKALVRPDYAILLDAATELGLDRLESQWRLLQNEGSSETTRAAPVTSRMLRHIRRGYEQVKA